MLSAGLPMVFAPECQAMMRKAGYDVEPYIARYASSMPRLMEEREKIGYAQREAWVKGSKVFRAELLTQIGNARRTL